MSSQNFEAAILEVLKGETQKNALDFAAFLRTNDMVAGGKHGEVTYKGKTFTYIHMDGEPEMPGPWTIWPDGDFSRMPEGFAFDETIKKIAWANVNPCGNCGSKCAPGSRKIVFGKEFDNLCGSVFAFHNPDADTMECVKQLLIMKT